LVFITEISTQFSCSRIGRVASSVERGNEPLSWPLKNDSDPWSGLFGCY